MLFFTWQCAETPYTCYCTSLFITVHLWWDHPLDLNPGVNRVFGVGSWHSGSLIITWTCSARSSSQIVSRPLVSPYQETERERAWTARTRWSGQKGPGSPDWKLLGQCEPFVLRTPWTSPTLLSRQWILHPASSPPPRSRPWNNRPGHRRRLGGGSVSLRLSLSLTGPSVWLCIIALPHGAQLWRMGKKAPRNTPQEFSLSFLENRLWLRYALRSH